MNKTKSLISILTYEIVYSQVDLSKTRNKSTKFCREKIKGLTNVTIRFMHLQEVWKYSITRMHVCDVKEIYSKYNALYDTW